MKRFFLFLFIALSCGVYAQTDSSYTSVEVTNEVYAIDFAGAKRKVLDFIKANNIQVQKQNDSKTDLNMKFTVELATYSSFDSLVNTIGYSKSKTINTVSNYTKVTEINLELAYLRNTREAYADLIARVDEKSENYLVIWNEKKQVEEKIFNKERELITLNKKENTYSVTLDLNDEITSPENTEVSFVNMPGLEYSWLKVESPKEGLSAKNYQGYFLKYLFTRGKSFATLGVYKNTEVVKTDTMMYNELFLLAFGQDFYSRHLGRGSRKFINLYSGYTVGGVFATGEKRKTSMFYLAPSIGVELFKSKYILIDTKVNYFVPLNSNTANLRGISYNASFNFVF